MEAPSGRSVWYSSQAILPTTRANRREYVFPDLPLHVPADEILSARKVFTDDDCYLSEFSALIDVMDGKADSSTILSTFHDAAETYKFVSIDGTPAGKIADQLR